VLVPLARDAYGDREKHGRGHHPRWSAGGATHGGLSTHGLAGGRPQTRPALKRANYQRATELIAREVLRDN
jgi:hypothetical protein